MTRIFSDRSILVLRVNLSNGHVSACTSNFIINRSNTAYKDLRCFYMFKEQKNKILNSIDALIDTYKLSFLDFYHGKK